jgi:hypothetical protein
MRSERGQLEVRFDGVPVRVAAAGHAVTTLSLILRGPKCPPMVWGGVPLAAVGAAGGVEPCCAGLTALGKPFGEGPQRYAASTGEGSERI